MVDRDALQAAVEAFASGDPERIVRHIDPEFEGVVPPSMSAEPDNYLGHEGVRRYVDLLHGKAVKNADLESMKSSRL